MSSVAKINQRANRIFTKSSELSLAAPDVINKRLTMFAMQNPMNNRTEMQEMELMVSEKQLAFMQSWQDMAMQTMISQQRLANTMMNNFFRLCSGKPIAVDTFMYQLGNETLKVIEKGMHPIHATATANSKRL